MQWSDHPEQIAPGLPAIWLVRTMASPQNLTERSTLRRGTARQVIARQLGQPEREIEIAHLSTGRPVLAGQIRPGLHLSLATRAGVVAVALAEAPIGVDIELIATGNDLALAVLHPLERQAVEAMEPARQPQGFALIWSAKEAYVKALGTGFNRAPESFAVRLLPGDRFAVEDPVRHTEARGQTLLIENRGRIALATAAIVLD